MSGREIIVLSPNDMFEMVGGRLGEERPRIYLGIVFGSSG